MIVRAEAANSEWRKANSRKKSLRVRFFYSRYSLLAIRYSLLVGDR
jgi:hypothetical protein